MGLELEMGVDLQKVEHEYGSGDGVDSPKTEVDPNMELTPPLPKVIYIQNWRRSGPSKDRTVI